MWPPSSPRPRPASTSRIGALTGGGEGSKTPREHNRAQASWPLHTHEGVSLGELPWYDDLRREAAEIGFTPEKIANGWDELRAMKTLKTVMTTQTRRFDAGELKK